jgi:hypothetical protein
MTWRRVYSLAEDTASVVAVQQAMLTRDDVGAEPDPAPFGTADWWRATEDGRIPTFTTEGTITAIRMASMNDFPDFEMTAEDGAKSYWAREGDPDAYARGLRAKVRYAVVKARPAQIAVTGLDTIEVVLEVWLDDDEFPG